VQQLAAVLPTMEAIRLVFVNGHYSQSLSSAVDTLTNEGLQLVRFHDADERQAATITQHLGQALPDSGHPFLALNQAALDDGLLVEIAAGTSISSPVQVIWLTTGDDSAFTVAPRMLVVAGANSKASIIEHYVNAGTARSLSNAVTELLLAPGATLDHYRLNLEEDNALHIGAVHANLDRDATLNSFYLGFGADLKRVDITANMNGPGAHAEINGIYLPRGDEQIDYHTCLEHVAPHCTSSEAFRGVMADRSRAIFNGRIHIHPNAQKTSAELSNKNLLTSAQAEVNTKPELEIYADDVKCAHGATVAQLDEQALHYLRSRGVARDEAEVMLGFGFVNEVLSTVRMPALISILRPMLARRFARDDALLRHLGQADQ
jgi:Fe-S cluster assembly protein SufD